MRADKLPLPYEVHITTNTQIGFTYGKNRIIPKMFHLRADRGDRIFQFFNILKSIACPNRDAKVHGDSFENFQTCSEPGGILPNDYR